MITMYSLDDKWFYKAGNRSLYVQDNTFLMFLSFEGKLLLVHNNGDNLIQIFDQKTHFMAPLRHHPKSIFLTL